MSTGMSKAEMDEFLEMNFVVPLGIIDGVRAFCAKYSATPVLVDKEIAAMTILQHYDRLSEGGFTPEKAPEATQILEDLIELRVTDTTVEKWTFDISLRIVVRKFAVIKDFKAFVESKHCEDKLSQEEKWALKLFDQISSNVTSMNVDKFNKGDKTKMEKWHKQLLDLPPIWLSLTQVRSRLNDRLSA